ncbi:hypothetical protein QE152_g18044 [Popillia japonica]|uniref:Uncharacterized protein n=1 Tax=Popillia japonica TaxID=7064 RepID=A0AAW1L4K5_POPJA
MLYIIYSNRGEIFAIRLTDSNLHHNTVPPKDDIIGNARTEAHVPCRKSTVRSQPPPPTSSLLFFLLSIGIAEWKLRNQVTEYKIGKMKSISDFQFIPADYIL